MDNNDIHVLLDNTIKSIKLSKELFSDDEIKKLIDNVEHYMTGSIAMVEVLKKHMENKKDPIPVEIIVTYLEAEKNFRDALDNVLMAQGVLTVATSLINEK